VTRVALVTGSAGGMGQAITRRLTSLGMLVAGLDRAESPLCELSYSVDVTSAEEVARAVKDIESKLGAIDVLVTTAGHYESTPLTDVTDEAALRMLRVHVGGLVSCAQAVLPSMLSRASGTIVAITSELAVGGGDRDSHYSMAKGAIIGVVRSLAAEVAVSGIRVNAVAPGPTNTPLLPADSPWRAREYLDTLPTRALAEPEDVAVCVEYLVSGATFTIGEVLNPNSGAVI